MIADGQPAFDCFAILDELNQKHPDNPTPTVRASRWDMLWNDLLEKSRGAANRVELLREGLLSQLPPSLRGRESDSLFLKQFQGSASEKAPADIIIVCVVEEEFNSTLAAFGVDQTKAKILTMPGMEGHAFFKLSVKPRYRKRALTIWISLIGSPRNVPCANFCRDLFERFDVTVACILVGIAAGHPDKFVLGDVVGAKFVWDMEGARVEDTKVIPRPIPYPLKVPWDLAFPAFNPERWGWLKRWKEGFKILQQQTGSTLPSTADDYQPKYLPGIVVAGEKLRRDGVLRELSDRYGDEILGLEMESSGFAAACARKYMLWFVFRGVADFGDGKKTKEWHSLASYHAALAAKNFIENNLVLPTAEGSEIPF